MKKCPDHKLAMTLNDAQSVVCTYIADKPYFYDSISEIDMARAIMREVRDELIICRDLLLSEGAR